LRRLSEENRVNNLFILRVYEGGGCKNKCTYASLTPKIKRRCFSNQDFVIIKDWLRGGKVKKKYTAIVRKSRLEYVAVCLELNVTARGEDLADVERNLRTAIELYLEDIKEHPETTVSPISIDDFIEFLKDTEPEWYREPGEGLILRPLEVHEIPSYA